MTRPLALALAALAILSSASQEADRLADQMTRDDECSADDGDCALNAIQLRGMKASMAAKDDGSFPVAADDDEAATTTAEEVAEESTTMAEASAAEPSSTTEAAAEEAGEEAEVSTTTAAAEVVATYEQCGGEKWDGPTTCKSGDHCAMVDKWYYQCWPNGSDPHKHEEPDLDKHRRRRRRRRRRSSSTTTTEPAEDEDDADDDESSEDSTTEAPAAGEPADEDDDAPEAKTNVTYSAPGQVKLKTQPPLPEVSTNHTTPPIVIKGNMLFDSKTGQRFFSKGVAYNPRNFRFDYVQKKVGECKSGEPDIAPLAYAADPTADELESLWSQALEGIAAMGANTVRLYNIDPEISHKKFMDKAASLGLYVIIPLTRHDWGFLPAGSPSPLCYTEELEGYGNVGTNVLVSAKLIVKQFSQYDNVLLFTVANEMTVADKNGYAAFPCVKALTRDIHRYQQECSSSMRRVPLVYSDMDMGPPYREMVGRYLTCELESPDDAVDAYGLNVYSWCDPEYPDETGKDNFEYSPYGPIRKEFQNFAKPLLFTEFGCNVGTFETFCPYTGGRKWNDVKTFFNQFKEIMSGAIAFEFSMEDNQFGLALTPGFTADPQNNHKIYYLDNYYNLKKEFNEHNVSTAQDGAVLTDCDWKPPHLQYTHKQSSCPSSSEVQKLFHDKQLAVKPNWASLPGKPANVNSDKLEFCPEYTVDPDIKAEGCCHMQCS